MLPDLWGRLKKGEDMDEWFEIFWTGTHTDSSGEASYWSKEDLDRIVSHYDPTHHEAPIVIGHPEHDSPSYGWIEALKREGDRLLAKPKQLIDEFKNWVNRGLYKKVSIALYPDLTLRHVGFLGAVPPAVKGLAQVQFSDRGKFHFFDFDLKGVLEMGKIEDPGRAIQRRVKEILRDPRAHVDRYGRRFSETMTYGEAFNYVCEEDPDLAKAYAETLHPTKPTEAEQRSLAAGKRIVSLIQEKMKADKNLNYSEALTEVSKENRDLILIYLMKK